MGRSIHASILLCLLLSVPRYSQERIDYKTLEGIERDAVTLLLKEDLGKVLEQLEQERPTTVLPLLRQLIIYSRAARPDGVLKTLQQLKKAPDLESAMQSYDVPTKIRQLIWGDLPATRFYYDELCPKDTVDAEAFLRLWEQKGDAKDLDAWLAAHSNGDDEWFWQRLYRRSKLGTADELIDPIKTAIRANPRDRILVQRYLRAVNFAGSLEDIAWLAGVCDPSGAYETYEVGQILSQAAPSEAIKFFQKSLSLPFTSRDAELLGMSLRVQVAPPKFNAEKQLRFWTKQLLAAAYQKTKRVHEAQLLIQELVTMKGDDIISHDVHQLAGSVQAQSVQRVVERKILVDEATQRQTARYWLERAQYYHGRSDYDLEKDTYLKALAAMPVDVKNYNVQWERLDLVRAFAFLLKENLERPQTKRELELVLRREFKLMPPESGQAFHIARLIADDEFELDELRRSLFVSQPNLVARVLNARGDWDNEEEDLIEDIVRGDEISVAEKDAIWNALEKLITEPGSLRAPRLAEAMIFHGALERAVPLLAGYLKSGANHDYVDRAGVLRYLIQAYCAGGKWHEAEEMLLSNTSFSWSRLAYDLGPIAASAAEHGATADAVRLWKIKVNLDRRDLSGLDQLARTEARAALRELYLQMKKDDPQSTIAEQALVALR
jgi:hypothetical protein